MVHFVDKKVSSKLPLIFVKEETFFAWIEEVFEAWENGELIGDDGTMLNSIVNRIPLTHIMKTSLMPTLSLRDSDLCDLAREILANKVCIKNTTKAKPLGNIMLFEWCKEKKLD